MKLFIGSTVKVHLFLIDKSHENSHVTSDGQLGLINLIGGHYQISCKHYRLHAMFSHNFQWQLKKLLLAVRRLQFWSVAFDTCIILEEAEDLSNIDCRRCDINI